MLTVAAFFLLLAFGMPIAFVMGWTPLVHFLWQGDLSGVIFPQRMFAATNNFVLVAIPFFMLAGHLMNEIGLTQQLVNLAMAIVGHIRGGLAMAAVLAGMLFAGTTGSATAEASALGTTLIPAMRKSGYDNDFAAAVMVSASTIGPIIPPSITAVVYAVLAEISVGALLLAGLVPGILLGLAQMVIVYVIARRKNYPRGPRVPWGQAVRAFIGAVPALLTPVIILGGIAGGVFTPTEAGAVACAYAVMLGFVTRRLTFRQLWRGVVETGRVTATIMIILATASVLSWVIAVERVPQAVAAGLLGVTASPVVILLLVNLALVVVGCFMDTAAAMILLVPVLAPLAVKIGVDPVHLGIIVVLNLVIGMATPPVGYALFIGCSIARASIDEISRRIWPFLLVSFAVLLLVTFVPAVSLWFPRLFVPF